MFKIKKEERLTEEVSFIYFYQILNVIYYLHRKKRMYLRKLSPEDIFIDGNDKVIISDFTQSVIREKNKKGIPTDIIKSIVENHPEKTLYF